MNKENKEWVKAQKEFIKDNKEKLKECPECKEVMRLCEQAITWYKIDGNDEMRSIDPEYYCNGFYENLKHFLKRDIEDDLTGERRWICGSCNYEEEIKK